ncbi:MAG TPA: cytochrome c maturation protein CcmE [Polyangiaceae bacterium]|jgi:cytochrome c-type biogenesis protein CcmE|nr:cytochrome c maturation protein CcmE [Polyangiaceae bacterium]
MSAIDDELAKAVEESENDEAARPVVVPEAAPLRPPPRRELKLLIALLVMGASILVLVMTTFNDSAIYSKGVDELLAQKDKLASRNLRVQGTLVKGTLVRRDTPCEYRFRMKKNGAEIEVRYPQCVVPDTFRDVPNIDVDVTATGKLASDGHFQASEIMAKCPSKYDMKQRAASGEKAPHAASFMPPAGPVGQVL